MKYFWNIIRSWFVKPKTALPASATNQAAADEDLFPDVSEVDLTIGLDWGASSTKCIIRDRYGPGDPAYVIDFGNLGLAGTSHLLPSRFFLSPGEYSCISFHNPDGTAEAIDGTKLALLDETLTTDQVKYHQVFAVLYLAYTIRFVIQNWTQKWSIDYDNKSPSWSLNVGIPAAKMDDSHIINRFNNVVIASWKLARKTGYDLNLKTAEYILNCTLQNESQDFSHINLVPEVAAQVATYAQSSFRRDGLHALVDVGAATVDTAMFILRKDDNDDNVYSILSAHVDVYGAYQLHKKRLESIQDIESVRLAQPSTIDTVPNDYTSYYPSLPTAKIQSIVSNIDEKFITLVTRSMHHVFHDVRKQKYPNAPEWKSGIIFFTCGGGYQINVYEKACIRLSNWWKDNTPVEHFSFMPLSTPENLRWFNGNRGFNRLSVAYGLSLPFIELGKVRSPGDIAPVPKLDSSNRNRFDNEDSKDWT